MNLKKHTALLVALSAITACSLSPFTANAVSIKEDIKDAQVQIVDDNSFSSIDGNSFIKGTMTIHNAPPFSTYDIYQDTNNDGLFDSSDMFIEKISCDTYGTAFTEGLENGQYFLILADNNGYTTDDMYYFTVNEDTPSEIYATYQDNTLDTPIENEYQINQFPALKASDTSEYLQSIIWNVPVYKQSGSTAAEWSSLLVNGCPGQTMGWVGCTITAFSMLYSFEKNNQTTPKNMMNMVTYAGNYGTTAAMNVAKTASDFGWTVDGTVANGNLTDNLKKIYTQLKNGNPVIICGYSGESASSSAHWVVITGYKGNGTDLKASDFIINDPANTTKSVNLEQFLAVKPKWSRLIYNTTPKTNAFSVIGGSPNTTLTILNDLNANGTYDEGDTVYKKVQTNQNGEINISDLPVGNYLLTKTNDDLPACYSLKVPYYSFNINHINPTSLTIAFSLVNSNAKIIDAPPSANLTLYSDLDNDGIYENNIPINSDKNGIITLSSLVKGAYRITKNVNDAPIGYTADDCYFNVTYGTNINVVMKTYAPGNQKFKFCLTDGTSSNLILDKALNSNDYSKLSAVAMTIKNAKGENISASLNFNPTTQNYEYSYTGTSSKATDFILLNNATDLNINNLPVGSYTATLNTTAIDGYQSVSSYKFSVDSKITNLTKVIFSPNSSALKINISTLQSMQPSEINVTTFSIENSAGELVTGIEKSNSYKYSGTTAKPINNGMPILGSNEMKPNETTAFKCVSNKNGNFYIDMKGLPQGKYKIVVNSIVDGYRTVETEKTVLVTNNTISSTSLLVIASKSNNKLIGDINGNGTIAIDDLMKVVNYCTKNSFLNFNELLNADINGDYLVNIKDMVILSKIIINNN